MKKFIVGIAVLFSLLFLFGGLFLVGVFSKKNDNKNEKVQTSYVIKPGEPKLSMKQIDSVTAKYNYNFTSANAAGISVYSVEK